jgi:protein SMG7
LSLRLTGGSYRSACVHTIFFDFQYAVRESVESLLWQAHSQVNSEYRRTLARPRSAQHVVLKRKLEKQYAAFLRTSQYFYKHYIQRLAACYELPELQPVVAGIKLEKMTIPQPVADMTPNLRRVILKSCYQTLNFLGDLSRYRSQAQQKVPTYEAALTYYGLAHDLNPKSGHAHHQMGIVYLGERKHLDMIYHFYRAWAIQEPHPNAQPNLESEFKSLLQPSPANRRSGPPDPQEAFVTWFAKLHARIYQGEPFPQHQELEDEVIHRLEMAAKAPNTYAVLLKMILVNIAAYHVVTFKIKGK